MSCLPDCRRPNYGRTLADGSGSRPCDRVRPTRIADIRRVHPLGTPRRHAGPANRCKHAIGDTLLDVVVGHIQQATGIALIGTVAAAPTLIFEIILYRILYH